MGGPPPGATRETKIRRDRHGRWFDGDVLIENEAIVRAFNRWVGRAPDGRYRLENEVNWAYVEIEGAPIFVRAVTLGDPLLLHLSDETTEPLDPTSLAVDDEGYLYCRVRDGDLEAQFTSNAAFALEPILDEDDAGLFLKLGGEKIHPPRR